MNKETILKELKTLEERSFALNHAMGMLSYDAVTSAPHGSVTPRGVTLSVLSGDAYRLVSAPETTATLKTILDDRDAFDETTVREAEELLDTVLDTTCLTEDEFVAREKLFDEASAVWHDAKNADDFAMFKPYLEKLVEGERVFAEKRRPGTEPYDVLLDMFEKGASRATLDPFFAALRRDLTPLVKAVGEKPAPNTAFLNVDFPLDKQRALSDKVMALMGIDRDHCAIGETEHPFTENFSKYDVRITTHYFEKDVLSSLYSVVHEGGHALYELGVADELQFTCLGTGASMGLHESQSRFMENLIGRSKPFCDALLPLLQEQFASFKDVTAEQLYRAVNKAQPSLIRTEADELTYPMHIMIRYELEKQLIGGSLKVAEVPEAWKAAYKDYLGVTVPNDKCGCLQDSHWSGGAFGYFPSYALGSAYGAQMLTAMEKDIPVWEPVSKGDLSQINAWLDEKVHRFGKLKKPAEILENACGAPFDPACYTAYLTKKFTELYSL